MLHPQTITVLLSCTILRHTVTGNGIINGERVPSGSMQYMVSLQGLGGPKCGGFLVSDRFVLTAAQCSSYRLKYASLGNPHRDYGTDIDIEKEFMHPSFHKTRDNGNDLLLLKLNKSALKGGNVATIQLPNENTEVKPDEKCQVAGWGAKEGSSKDLTQTAVSIIDIKTCKAKRSKLPGNVICTHENRFGSGDAGGPLVCNDVAVGIVSFTKHDEGHLPGVFVDISKYLVWINETIKNN